MKIRSFKLAVVKNSTTKIILERKTLKKMFYGIISLIVIGCAPQTENYKVEYKGSLKSIMHGGEIFAKFSLSDLEKKDHLYALGAIENLKGEIQIFDSEPFITFAKNDQISFDNSFSKNATLIVYVQVSKWEKTPIPDQIISRKELENFVAKIAKENGLDLERPFPFLVVGEAKLIDWHVIDWEDGDQEHSHEKHVKSGPNGRLTNSEVEILGFYSDKHHAIFTHHTTNMHLHFRTKDHKIAGHIDEIELASDLFLKLPQN